MLTIKDMFSLIKTAAEIVPFANINVYRSYSGRGMYGRSCIGFTCSNRKELVACAALVAAAVKGGFDPIDVVYTINRAAIDSMGRDVVVYFPGIADNGDEIEGDDKESDPTDR
jgi:hypothetical protein